MQLHELYGFSLELCVVVGFIHVCMQKYKYNIPIDMFGKAINPIKSFIKFNSNILLSSLLAVDGDLIQHALN